MSSYRGSAKKVARRKLHQGPFRKRQGQWIADHLPPIHDTHFSADATKKWLKFIVDDANPLEAMSVAGHLRNLYWKKRLKTDYYQAGRIARIKSALLVMLRWRHPGAIKANPDLRDKRLIVYHHMLFPQVRGLHSPRDYYPPELIPILFDDKLTEELPEERVWEVVHDILNP